MGDGWRSGYFRRPRDYHASAELQMLRSRMRRLKDSDNHCLISIRVSLRRRDRDVPQQLLDGAQIPAFSQEVRGEAMPQRMGCSGLRKVERHPDPNHHVLGHPRVVWPSTRSQE